MILSGLNGLKNYSGEQVRNLAKVWWGYDVKQKRTGYDH